MKKFVFSLLSFILLLSGCSNNEAEDADYSPFLAEESGNYGVYVVADSENIDTVHDELWKKDTYNVSDLRVTTSLEDAQLSEIEEIPTFIVFDTEEKIYETHEWGKLLEFLEES